MRWVLALLLLFPAPALAQTYEQVVRQFEAIAFSDEDGTYKNRLERVDEPVRIRVYGSPHPALATVIAELHDLTGLDISVSEPANVLIRFGQDECRFSTKRGEPGYIWIAHSIPVHCLYEELAQLVGPADDACHYRPSIFCDGIYPERYAEADKIILRTLFDPRLKIGMTKAEGMPIARQIIREMMP